MQSVKERVVSCFFITAISFGCLSGSLTAVLLLRRFPTAAYLPFILGVALLILDIMGIGLGGDF